MEVGFSVARKLVWLVPDGLVREERGEGALSIGLLDRE